MSTLQFRFVIELSVTMRLFSPSIRYTNNENFTNWYLQCPYVRSRISKQLSCNNLNGIVLKFTMRKKWNWITKKLIKVKCQVAWKTQAVEPPSNPWKCKVWTVTTSSLRNTVLWDIFQSNNVKLIWLSCHNDSHE